MQPTEDLRIRAMSPIVAPEDLKRVFPLTSAAAEFVSRSRKEIQDVSTGAVGASWPSWDPVRSTTPLGRCGGRRTA